MKLGFCAAFALAAAIAAAAPVQAGVVLDTFGPGNAFDNSSGGYTVGDGNLSAVRFTLGTSGIVDDVAVAAQAVNFSLFIVGDSSGLPGAGVLGTLSGNFSIDGYIEFDPSIALAAGNYWLVMGGAPNSSGDGWYFNSEFLDGPFVQSDSNGADWLFGGIASLPAVRVGFTEADLVAVPTPGAFSLFGAGLLGLVAIRRKGQPD
jgi:hypothetical protein